MKNLYRLFNPLVICLMFLLMGHDVLAQFPAPYCAITFPSNNNDVGPITLVEFAGINNVTNNTPLAANTNQLENFTAISGIVTPGLTYPIKVKGNTEGNWPYYVTAFIDWNKNNIFETGETYNIGTITNSTGIDAIVTTSSIPVPATASGSTRMRVTFKYSAYATACNNTGWGQAEDYTIVVSNPAPNNASVGSVLPVSMNFCSGNQDVKALIKNTGNNIINYVYVNWEVDGIAQTPVFWNNLLDTIGGVNKNDTLITLGNLAFASGSSKNIKVWTSMPNGIQDTVNVDDTIAVNVAAKLNCASLPAACTPAFTSYSSCVGGNITNVTFAGINNSVTCLTGGGHRDYSNAILAPLVSSGQSYPVSVTIGTSSYRGGAAIWIDYDRNGTFDPSELAFTGPYNGGNPTPFAFTGSITIPSGATPGYVRMRVVGRESATPTAPCGAGYGEAQDYLLYINSKGYNNASTAAIEPATLSFCGGNTDIKARIRNNGSNVINFVTVNWELDGIVQSAISWSNPIDTFGSATGNDTLLVLGSVNFITGTPHTVKVWTSLPNFVNDTLNADDTLFVSISNSPCTPLFPLPYCGISTTPSQVLPISLVKFATINNASSSTPTTPPALEDFTGVSANVTVGQTYPITVKGNTDGAWNYLANVFIDWNKNNVFTDPGESYNIGTIYNSTGLDAAEVTTNITIPPNAVNGATRMRVMFNYFSFNTSPCDIMSGYGQAEDYTLNIRPRAANNTGISALVSPVNYCPGNHDIKVRLTNEGSNLVNNVTINWELNGVAQSPVFWSSPIDTFGSIAGNDTVVLLTNALFTASTPYSIKVWTSYPNNVPDTSNLDDTLYVNTKTSLNGTFIIGAAPSDYTTIGAAITDLNTNGVCGPVTLLIKTGTYTNQQVTINAIQGASSTNTVTISSQANHRDSVVITNSSTSTNNYLLRLNQANYVTVKNISFTALNSTYSNVVELVGNASFDTITNCKLTSQTASGSSTNSVQLYASAFSGRNIVFTDNLLLNGSYGIYWIGMTTPALYPYTCTFRRNTIQGSSYASAYMMYNTNLVYSNNNHLPAAAASYGLYCYYTDSSLEITGNKISGQNSGYGIQMRYITGSSLIRPLIANNSIAVGNGTGTSYGLWCRDVNYGRFYNNTVNVASTGSSSVAGYFYFSSSITSINNEIKNNVFANNGGNYAMYNYQPANTICDYNNIYSNAAASFISTLSANYNNLASWRSATSQDLMSVSYRPGFTSNTDLTPNVTDSAAWSLNGRALHIPDVISSVNNITRPATYPDGAPDIGAYEFTPSSLPPAAVANPATPAAGSTQVFTFAGDTIAKISWDAFSSVPPAFSMRQHSGERPAIVSPNALYTNNFISNDMQAGAYNYTLEIPYREGWKGTIVNESDMRITSFTNTITWWTLNTASSVDPAANKMTGQFYQGYQYFMGTDQYNPLPVRLISFSASAHHGNVVLKWATADEKNNKGFEVEYSTDGKSFFKVDFVKAKNTANARYEFTHAGAFAITGINKLYYRIKQVDVNDAASFSEVKLVYAMEESNRKVEIYPNPAINETSIRYHSQNASVVRVELYDVHGKQLFNKNVASNAGENTFVFDELKDLAGGIYFIKITVDGHTTTERIIKQSR